MTGLRSWGSVLLLVTAATFITPGIARAFPDEPNSLDEGPDAHTSRFQLFGELGLFSGRTQDTKAKILLSPLFQLRLQLAENWLLDTAWGFGYLSFTANDGDITGNSFRAGNPYAAIHYQGVKGQFSYRFGVGVAAPVARLPDTTDGGNEAGLTYNLSAAIRGNTSAWLWEPHSLSVIFPMAFERRKPSGFIWGANLAAGIMISCCGSEKARDPNGRNDPVIELGSVMAYQALSWLRVGSTFNLVILPRQNQPPPNEVTQLSLQPFLRFGREDAFTSVGVLINLDNPWGFSFDKEQVWGLLIGGGAAF